MPSKILIVEDESIEAMNFENVLKSAGYDVVGIASTGEDAIKKTDNFRPDLILMDIILKGEIDGVETATQIKEKYDIPIIYLTARPEESAVKRAKLTSPYGYLIKPVNKTELKNTIELALYKHNMESKLIESEERFRYILENSLDAAYKRNLDSNKYEYMSPAIEIILGYSPEELISMPSEKLFDMIHPDDQERVKDTIIQLFSGEIKTLNLEFRTKHKNGEYKWLTDFGSVVHNKKTTSVIGSLRDITEQVNTRELIFKERNKLQSILDAMLDGVYIINKDYNIEYINPYIEKEFGQFKGQKCYEYFHDRDTVCPWCENEVVFGGKTVKWEWTSKKKGKTYEVFDIPFQNPDETISKLEILHDITPRKKVEDKLKESSRRFSAVAESAVDAIVTTDSNGNIIFFNDSLMKIFGYKREEMTGQSLTILMPKRFKKTYLNELKRFRESGKHRLIGRTTSTRGLRKNGTEFPFEMSLSYWESEDNTYFTSIIRDITERKKAEKALSESEQRLSDIIDFLPDAMFAVDREGKIITWNRAVEEMTGTRKEDIIGKGNYAHGLAFYGERRPCLIDIIGLNYEDYTNFYDYINKKDQTLKAEVFAPLLYGGNGAYVWVKASPLLDSEGNPYGAIETVRDITEYKREEERRKRGEEALKKSEERFRAVAESAVDAIVTTDENGKIILFNESLSKIFGYEKEEMSGQPLTILMPERFKKNYLDELQKFKKSGEHRLIGKTVTTTGMKKDGTEFPFEMSLAAWKSGGKTFFTSIIRDITRQKIAEEQTQDHLKKLTIMNKIINLANNASDIDELLEEILKSTIELLGYDGGCIYLLEENQKFANLVHYENYPAEFFKEYERINLEEIPSYAKIYTNKKPLYINLTNKTTIKTGFTSFAIVPLYSAGRVIGSINVSSSKKHDFSELEKDIIEAIGMEIGTVITKMYSEEQIKDSLREKEVLLKEIHHRVKNNLQIISSLLDLQEDFVKENTTAVNVLKESQNRVLSMAMIHEMIYQSKDLSHINFSDYIRNITSSLFHSYGTGSNITLNLQVDQIFLNIETAIPLGLLITELVSNSLKYAFPQEKTGEILVSLKYLDENLELIISDNGIGIAQEIDFQTESTLGLRLVQSLVNQLDGTINLEKNHGTKYTIIFSELKYKQRI